MMQEKDLYALRKALNLSQERLAEKLGVSRNTISRWERGNFNPSAENLNALNRLYAELEGPAAPEGETVAQAPGLPAKPKSWPMAVMCIGVVCSLLIGIVSLVGIYSINQKLEPEDTAIPIEELEDEEIDISSAVAGARVHLQP